MLFQLRTPVQWKPTPILDEGNYAVLGLPYQPISPAPNHGPNSPMNENGTQRKPMKPKFRPQLSRPDEQDTDFPKNQKPEGDYIIPHDVKPVEVELLRQQNVISGKVIPVEAKEGNVKWKKPAGDYVNLVEMKNPHQNRCEVVTDEPDYANVLP